LGGSFGSLTPDGPTLNDPLDSDAGFNSFQNFPEIHVAEIVQGGIRLAGTLDSSPDTAFTLDFYANSTPILPATAKASDGWVGPR